MIQTRLKEELKEKLKEKSDSQGSSQKSTPLAAYIRKENGHHHTEHSVVSSKENSAKDPDVIDRYVDENRWHEVREDENGYHMMKGSIWAMVSRNEKLTMSSDRAEVLKRDSAGATVFHAAFLSKRYEIAR